jgi:uncharacterized protein (TIGR03067 family)
MHSRVVAVGLSLCLAVTAWAQDEVKKDAEQLQGAWEATAYETAGRPATADEVKAFKVRVEGDRLTITTTEATTKTKFKLDPSASPKAIDLVIEDGDAKGKTVLGIYEVKGDELKLCVREVAARGGRPKGFKTEKEDANLSVTLKRSKK